MRVLLELSLVGVVSWSPAATPPPPGHVQPPAQDASPDAAKATEAVQPQDSVPSAEQPAEAGPEQADDPDATDPEVDPPSPEVDPPQVADPGDARPDGASTHEHLLAIKKPLGPKQIESTAAVYGMVMANVVFDTGTVGPTGESPVFALPGSAVGEGLPSDGQFLITARQSRFGLKGGLQVSERVDINALIEVDFFGLHENEGPTSVIQPGVRLRLAKLDLGDDRFRFIAGQDWSVVTPRLPTSLSHTVVAAHSFGGAVWGRLPQVTFAMRQPLGSSNSRLGDPAFTLKVSAARHFSGDGFGGGITRFDRPDPGTLSRLPVAQMHVGFDSKLLSIGAGGHLGRETYQVARLDADGGLTTIDDHVPSWMATADLKLAGKWVWFTTQGYYGRNINGMLSNQGVRFDLWSADAIDPADPRVGQPRDVVDLPGAGGWAELGARLGTEKLTLVASGGADVGDRERVPVGGRWLNTGILAGLIYAPLAQLDMSLEYQRIMSFYRAATSDAPIGETRGNNDFVAASFRFKF
ncbi:MAG: hypothetical protein R6X02_27665 [Enhygromyxa sp.]